MSNIPSTWPEYQNLVELQPKVQEERKLDSFPKLSFPVGTLVIETWGRIDYVLTAWWFKEERQKLQNEVETVDQKRDRLYKQEFEKLKENFSLNNLDNLLNDPYLKWILESALYDISKTKFDVDNNLLVDWKILIKWSKEYNDLVNQWLQQLYLLSKALLIDAQNRKSDMIFKIQK